MGKHDMFPHTGSLVDDVRLIIENGRKIAYSAASEAAVLTYWNVGRRLVEEEQDGKARATYGTNLIEFLAEQLQKDYGTGFGRRNLAYYRKFYLTFKDWKILHEFVQNLTWTHLRRFLSVSNERARIWYLQAASENRWNANELDRNISTQYFERRPARHVCVYV